MTAIVRQTMGKGLSTDLIQNIESTTNEYYIGIGKSDIFNVGDTPIDPIDSPFEEREFRNNLQSIKKVEGCSFVAPRVNWSSGTIYAGWDDHVDPKNTTPWYVLNDAKEVYICLEHGKNPDGTSKPSVIEPNYSLLNVPYVDSFTTSDDYVWKFLYSITPERIYQFLSSNHIPVQPAESSLGTGDSIEDLQFNVKSNSQGGQIISAKIINSGTGYITEPTVEVIGNGSGAIATAIINSSGQIVDIKIQNYGSGYSYASFKIGGDGQDFEARTIITGENGIGFNPIDDLKTNSILLNIKPNGEVLQTDENGVEFGTFIVENSFRQMGVIKNPLTPEGNPFTSTSSKVLPSITLVNNSTFETGKKITGDKTGAVAHVDESDGKIVRYHQNQSTGFVPFELGEGVSQGSVSGVVESLSSVNGINRFSGEIMYIENRHKIRRDAEQQEDIKIVLTV